MPSNRPLADVPAQCVHRRIGDDHQRNISLTFKADGFGHGDRFGHDPSQANQMPDRSSAGCGVSHHLIVGVQELTNPCVDTTCPKGFGDTGDLLGSEPALRDREFGVRHRDQITDDEQYDAGAAVVFDGCLDSTGSRTPDRSDFGRRSP